MILPSELKFRETLHGHGANGMYVYCYQDVLKAGVTVEVRRESRRVAETQAWRHVALPEQEFATLSELRAALEMVTDEQAAAEAAKWPQAKVESVAETTPNRCRLCPREPRVPGPHTVLVKTSWSEITFYASLCAEHAALASEPRTLLARLEAEVAERKARAKPLLGEANG